MIIPPFVLSLLLPNGVCLGSIDLLLQPLPLCNKLPLPLIPTPSVLRHRWIRVFWIFVFLCFHFDRYAFALLRRLGFFSDVIDLIFFLTCLWPCTAQHLSTAVWSSDSSMHARKQFGLETRDTSKGDRSIEKRDSALPWRSIPDRLAHSCFLYSTSGTQPHLRLRHLQSCPPKGTTLARKKGEES